MPSSSAWRIVASEAPSSCGPQLKAQPPPPMAHAPKPTLVISSPLVPRGRVGNVMISPLCLGLSFKDDLTAHMAALTHFLSAAAVTLNAYCLILFLCFALNPPNLTLSLRQRGERYQRRRPESKPTTRPDKRPNLRHP